MYYSSCSATDNCLAGMKLTVFRGESATEETFSIVAENNLKRTEGPVVAFYGLIQGTNLCIARLGGYRLLDSSELSSMFYIGLYNHYSYRYSTGNYCCRVPISKRHVHNDTVKIGVFELQCMLYHACVPEKYTLYYGYVHCTIHVVL